MMSPDEIRGAVEAILFVAGEPVQVKEISRWLGVGESVVEISIKELSECYSKGTKGIRLLEIGGGWQFCTDPHFSGVIAQMTGQRRSSQLSQAAIETLSIIAYRQPITKAEIEQIRGVNVDGVVGALADRELITEVGRKETIGRPILYAVTPKFLRHFGLKSVDELPSLDEFSEIAEPADDDAATGSAADRR
jgi:segregation and condensation protein B